MATWGWSSSTYAQIDTNGDTKTDQLYLKVRGIELAGLSVLSACNDASSCILWSNYRGYSGHLSYIK